MPYRAVFLDRDGVINKVVMRDGKPASPRSLAEFEFEDGIEAAVNQLKADGFKIFVVTNQPEVARGLVTAEAVSLMTERIMKALAIDAVRMCPHDNADECGCRKPRPGMLMELAGSYDLALSESFIIGDTWKDTRAGHGAGCRSIILDRSYNREDPADWRVANLREAVELIRGLAGYEEARAVRKNREAVSGGEFKRVTGD